MAKKMQLSENESVNICMSLAMAFLKIEKWSKSGQPCKKNYY